MRAIARWSATTSTRCARSSGACRSCRTSAGPIAIDLPDAPLGAPDDFTELLDVQFELMALAWQTNQTRIATLPHGQ